MGVDPPVQGGSGGVAAVALGGEHLEQLAPARHQRPQAARRLVGQGPHGRPHRLGEAGDRLRVQAVGLRQPTYGAGEGAHLARVDDRDRQAGRGQGRREADLHAAGRLEHDQRRRERGQAADQGRHALVIVVGDEALAGRAQVDVEAQLGDVDADEHGSGSLVHDPVSLDAGLSALVTVRVRGTRPAGLRVFARPWWTCRTAGSRRPTRSRYQIGSRQHTNGTVALPKR